MGKEINPLATKTIKTINDINDSKTIIEIIRDIDYRLTHIEEAEVDNRKLIARLVKQGNTIVEFLKRFEVEEIDPEDLMIEKLPELPFSDEERMNRTVVLKDMIDNIIKRHENLKEFENELKKHKDKITPGQVGEA